MELARMVRVASVTLAMKETPVPTRHVSYPANMAAHVTKYPRAQNAPARIGRASCVRRRSVPSSVSVALVNTGLQRRTDLSKPPCTATVLLGGQATYVTRKVQRLQVPLGDTISYKQM